MNFFMNSSFNAKNSGIEHAQLKRAFLFRKNKEAYKLVFREWNPLLHFHLNNVGIHDDEILNMFDFFQEAEDIKEKVVRPEDLDFGVSDLTYQNDDEHNRVIVFKDKLIIARVNCFGKDITDEKRVQSVELFDGFANLYRVDFYDIRGFKSMVQWYTPDNKIATETWYTPSGRPVIEDYYRLNAQGKMDKSGWKTVDKKGTVRQYDTIDGVLLEFLNAANHKYLRKTRPNIFIMDRSDLYEELLPELREPAYTVLHLHNSHAGDAQEPNTSIMNNNYEYSLTDANRYDAIISATHKQTRDVKYRFEPKAAMFTIPVGVIPDKHFDEPRVPMKDRKFGSVIATARIAPEKQLDKVIRAAGIARKTVPEVTVDLYGYIDHSNDDIAMKRINEAIKDYNMEDAVHIHSYVNNVSIVQKNAQIYGLASVMEGFNLAMMEAQSEGDVGITYDVNYGPNELVVDGENGYVVDYGDYKKMGQYMTELFTNPDQLQKMSDEAYELSKRYSETNVWKDWKALLDDAAKKWRHKMAVWNPDIEKGLEKLD
ncbi:glycosyltransferase [Lactobacillaceae bacterium Melli_B4]